MRSSSRHVLPFVLCMVFIPQVLGEVVYDEASMGDLSNDNTAPDDLGFFVPGATGSTRASSVLGQTDSEAPDIFTFEIAGGNELRSLSLSRYEEGDNAMFVAMAAGDQFPNDYFEINDPFFADTSAWLGGSTVGNTDVTMGTNLLARMGSIGIGSGFAAPLGAGKYTFYIQQTGPLTTYTLDFNVASVTSVPEPSITVALSILAVGGIGYRRHQRRKRDDKDSQPAERSAT